MYLIRRKMDIKNKDDKRREHMRNLNRKRKMQILKATNNGRCWWLYQMLTYNANNARVNKR